MWDIGLVFINWLRILLVIAFGLLVSAGCTPKQSHEQPRDIQLHQSWELQPGDVVAGHQVTGGLGDISIELKGDAVYAPFSGRVQPHKAGCVIYSSSELPAYLFRLCGLKRPNLGSVRVGEAIGAGDYLQFAALRKQPGGTWALVEPSKSILERILKQP